MTREEQKKRAQREIARKKAGEIMQTFYNTLKNNTCQDNLGDSSLTDISTIDALKDLRPKCPLKIQEIIAKEETD